MRNHHLQAEFSPLGATNSKPTYISHFSHRRTIEFCQGELADQTHFLRLLSTQTTIDLLKSGVRLAAEELAGAGAADEFADFDDGAAPGENGFGGAFDFDALEHGIVDAHVVSLRANDFFMVWIEDHQVGIGADGDGAFARIEAKEFCGGGGDELDEAVRRKMFAVDSTGVHET